MGRREEEADEFYAALTPPGATADEARLARQAFAGMLWGKEFYHYDVLTWLRGDPAQPAPPTSRWEGRNARRTHHDSLAVMSMPDKWEYPWYASWDLAFHTTTLADIDRRIRETEDAYARPGGTPRDRYEREMRRLEDHKRDLEGQYSNLGHTSSFLWRYAGRPGALRGAWDTLSLDEQNALIKETIGQVAVMPAVRRERRAWDSDRLIPTVNGLVPLRMRPLADAG